MVEGWNNSPKIYDTVKVNIDNAISFAFIEVDNKLKTQIKELVNSINSKLSDAHKALELKQKDKESFNRKIKKI